MPTVLASRRQFPGSDPFPGLARKSLIVGDAVRAHNFLDD